MNARPGKRERAQAALMNQQTELEGLTDEELREADRIARGIVVNVTGIDDLVDLWMKHGYRPTIDTDEGPDYAKLADYYDRRAKERGIRTEAFRLQRRRP